MIICPYAVSTIDRTKAGAGSVIGRTHQILLTETRCDHVAAAGKPGVSGGAGTTAIRPK